MDQETSSDVRKRRRSEGEEEEEEDGNLNLSLTLSIGSSSSSSISNTTNLPSSSLPLLFTNPVVLPSQQQHQHDEQFLHPPPISSLQLLQQQQRREEAIQVPPLFDTLSIRREQEEEAIVDPPSLNTVRLQPAQEEAIEIPTLLNTQTGRRRQQQANAVPPAGMNIGRRQQRHASQRISSRTRRNQSSNARVEIIPPFPWATNRPAGVHTLEYLRSNNLTRISNEVLCKRCNAQFIYEYDLEQKFREVSQYIYNNKDDLLHRAAKCWLQPELPACDRCEQLNCLKPVMPEGSKGSEKVNWLFLLLGQLLGLCTLEQLKYFCQHTKNHRTGAKDRVLFLTYLALCKQLDPNGPYDLF